jgi:hypothetical protein
MRSRRQAVLLGGGGVTIGSGVGGTGAGEETLESMGDIMKNLLVNTP